MAAGNDDPIAFDIQEFGPADGFRGTQDIDADVEILVGVMNRFFSLAPDHNLKTFQELVARFGVEKPNFRIKGGEQGTFF